VDDLGTCLVTGAAGFLGGHLTRELARRGHEVVLTDRRLVPPDVAALATRVHIGDLADAATCRDAVTGCRTVFHCAGVINPIGLLPEAERADSHDTNVTATAEMVRACQDAGVKRFVHVASNNVAFDCHPAAGLDESHPYPTKFIDVYTETKGEGERIALAADGDADMNTAAVRPGGIYGPGDMTVLGRMVAQAAHGRLHVGVGDPAARTDFTFVGNLTDAMVRLAEALGPDSKVRGHAYFINDGVPVNSFELVRPVLESLGLGSPKAYLPGKAMYPLAWVMEVAYARLHGPRPFLSRSECLKISEDNWYRIERAEEDFGWTPPFTMEEGLQASLPWCREVLADQELVDVVAPGWWVLLLGGLATFGVITFEGRANRAFHRVTGGRVPQASLVAGFAAACGLHVAEAVHARRTAKAAGLDRSADGWAAQTLLVGFPSLGNLRRTIRNRTAD